MNIDFFLGANSGEGFFSLYDDFPGGENNLLHIIKGGPGTGKSGFMKRLCREAERRGLDTQRILCSGDPDSLDGVYIPALHQAWVDGTAPHAIEPGVFGIDSDYVNLGAFCSLPMKEADCRSAESLSREYKRQYSEAYRCLAAAAQLDRCELPPDNAPLHALGQSVRDIITGVAPAVGGYPGREQRRFISALSCQGHIRLNSSISKLCKHIYVFEDERLASGALKLVREEAIARSLEALVCPDPLMPKEAEAVLLPRLSIGFVSPGFELSGAITIPGSSGIEPGQAQKIKAMALEHAFEKLRCAKELHDRLEQVYRPYMDFDALTAFTDGEIERVF